MEQRNFTLAGPAQELFGRSSSDYSNNIVEIDLTGWDVSGVTDLTFAFCQCRNLKNLDISTWDTSSVFCMEGMFYWCDSLETLLLGNLDVSNVEKFGYMFDHCYMLKNLQIDTWNPSSALNMSNMFAYCSSLEELNLNSWDMSSVWQVDSMFKECVNLKNLEIGNWNTSSLALMNGMFKNCYSLEKIDLNSWDVSSVREMDYAFNCCYNLTSLSVADWDTSSLTTMKALFTRCYKLKDLNVSDWNTSSVVNATNLFSDCNSIEELDLSKWDTSCFTDAYMMFNNCISLKTLNVYGWNLQNVTDLDYMFSGCENLTELDLSSWKTAPDSIISIVSGCKNLISLDLTGIDTSKVNSFTDLFYNLKNLEILKIDTWNFSNVSSMYRMFRGCSKLKKLDTSKWDTSNVMYMTEAFSGCSNLEEIDVSNWNTQSLSDMSGIFRGCYSLVSLDVGNWDVSSVENMDGAFNLCKSLTKLDLNNWDISGLTTLRTIFSMCENLTELGIDQWDVSNVTDFSSVLAGTKSLRNLDLSSWDVSSAESLYGMFASGGNPDEYGIENWDVSHVNDFSFLFRYSEIKSADFLKSWNISNARNLSYMFADCLNLETANLPDWTATGIEDISFIFYECNNLKEIDLRSIDLSTLPEYPRAPFYNNYSLNKVTCGFGSRLIMELIPEEEVNYFGVLKWYRNGEGPYLPSDLPSVEPGEVVEFIREDYGKTIPRYQDLFFAIVNAEGLDEAARSLLLPDEREEYENALEHAKYLLTVLSPQEEVDAAAERLNNSWLRCLYRLYYDRLSKTVAEAEIIESNLKHYEPTGVDLFLRNLRIARDLLSSDKTDYLEFAYCYLDLQKSMEQLIKIPAPETDKAKLLAAITDADGLSDVFLDFMTLSERLDWYSALTNAKEVYSDEYAEQTVIDEAEARLTYSYVPILKQKFTVLLTETIAEAEKIESDLYSYMEEGKDEFIAALNLARESVAQADAGYEELYTSLTGLQEAMSVLELRPVPETNKEALSAAIEKAEGLGEEYLSQLSEEQRTEFDAALQNARDVLADKYAEQNEVDQAESRLKASYVPVLNETFRSLLSAAITEAEKTEADLESYKEEGREPFLHALQAARETLANTAAGYEELHGALSALQEAMSSLELRPIPETNKTALADRIEKAESLGEEYLSHLTEEEKTEFEAALENARKVYADKYAEQDEVDQAETTLKNSYVPVLNAKFRILLSETVASAADMEPELDSYKEEGREAFRAALKAARETLAREDAGFQDYHSCTIALQNAMSSLELRPVPETNKESLLAAIEKAENLEEEFLSQLNEAQRSEFDAALMTAKDVLADKYAEQEEVDQAETRLVASYIPVLNETYRSLLSTAVAEAEKTEADLDSYKEEGKAPFTAALETARAVLAKEDADYREMSASLKELQEAMANLELRPVPETNKAALTAAIEKAETLADEYVSMLSEEQKSEFEAALAQAKKVCADKYAEQEEVDQAESRLIASFVPVLDEAYRSLLSAAVEEAEKLETDLESYKEEGRTPFLNALYSARETLSDDAADYEVLNGALKELQNAVSALELRPVPDTNKAALAERIEKAESLDSVYLSEMNEAEKAELEAALENARKVYADKYAEQEEADQAETRLMNAYVPVLNAKFRTLLAETLNEAAEIESDLESYKEEGREAFRSALKAARETLAREDAGFQDYHSCRTTLQSAISALELRPVPETNKEALTAAIEKAEGLSEEYLSQLSEEQRTEFDAALQNARDVLADKYAEQNEVDQAESRLKASYVPVLNETFRSLLSAAITEAEKAEADLESYKEEGREPFLHALQAARETLANTAAGYEELHGALTALQEAMSSLELRPVPETDKGGLSEAIAKAENLSDDCHSHLSETEKAEFDAALKHAKAVFSDKYAEQTEVDEALNRLENSYIPVLNTAFRNLLTEAVAEAADIESSLESYKEEGREAFLSALKTAREALASEQTEYEVLSAALTDLQTAVSALELRPVPDTNKENLASVIEKAEKLSAEYLSQMSEEEKAEFDAALFHAREIYADKYAEQSETDQAASRLTDSFVPVLNGKFRTLLNNAVEEAAAIEADLDSYKEDGKENFLAALRSAREKLANETADYEELNAALVSLQTAVQALEPKTVPETDKGTLSAAIEKAENLEAEYLSMLDEEARTEFDAALANARKVLADRYAEQAEIDQAAARLNDSYVPALNAGCRALLSKAAEEASAVEADLENYKEEGKAAFLQALKLARDALVAEDSTYEVLHAALQELQEAMSALELIPIPETDKEALQTRILEAMELKEEYLAYMSEEEKAEFDAALANAKRVYADKYAEQTEVDQAELRLTNSYVQVLKNTFRGILEQTVSKGEYIEAHPGDYEETGMPEFLEALNNAREILSREDAEYTHYYAFNQLLQEDAGRLVIRPANTETAEILIEAVEVISPENFTPATWAVFEEGLEEIRQLVADGAPQSVVDQAVTSLHTKYLNLRMVPSEDQLQQLLGFNEVAETLNMELYAQPFAARIHTLTAKIDSSVKDPEFSISDAEELCKEASEILSLIENPTQEILADSSQTSGNLTEPKKEENLTPVEKKEPETKNPETKQEVTEKQNAAEESKVPETVLDRQKASAAPEQARSVKTAAGLSAGLYSGLLAAAAGVLSKMKSRNKKK